MVKLTIEISPDLRNRLKGLQDRINQKLAPAIERGLDRPLTIEEIAAALVDMAIFETSTDKDIFGVMVASQQLREVEYEKKGNRRAHGADEWEPVPRCK